MVRVTVLLVIQITSIAAVRLSTSGPSWSNATASDLGLGPDFAEYLDSGNAIRRVRRASEKTTTAKPRLVKDFDAFKSRYKKTYKRQFREYRSKLAFESNKNLVLEQEKNYKEGKSSFRCATNALSDLSQTEYWMRYVRMTSNYFNRLLDGDHLVSAPLVNSADIPKELDWRESGFVTPPDNQKSCGSCYAFSIVRSIEGELLYDAGGFGLRHHIYCDDGSVIKYFLVEFLLAKTEYFYYMWKNSLDHLDLHIHVSHKIIACPALHQVKCFGEQVV